MLGLEARLVVVLFTNEFAFSDIIQFISGQDLPVTTGTIEAFHVKHQVFGSSDHVIRRDP